VAQHIVTKIMAIIEDFGHPLRMQLSSRFNSTNTSFSLNSPNNLECYNTLVWKGLSVKNTLAYWAHS